MKEHYQISPDVSKALAARLPVVALESTVITHGLPYPENRQLAQDMEAEVRGSGATPATIAVVEGKIRVGLAAEDLAALAQARGTHKISSRDFAPAVAKGWTGGTTVAATMVAAHAAGVRVFATGGIGGVHRVINGEVKEASVLASDISADLPQLARTPVVVVCAGAKAILDLPATLEYLETWAVPVVGYQTDDFPAFYSRSSGLGVSVRADGPAEVVEIALAHWRLGFRSAVLVVAPPPEELALPRDQVEAAVEQALAEAGQQQIRGQQVTPFLLERMVALTGGASLQANLGLLRNNARVAAAISREFSRREGLLSA